MNIDSNPNTNTPQEEGEIPSVEPKWMTLKKKILADIQSGKYVPGDMLPSEHYFRKKMNLARNTIRQALMELEKMGVVQKKWGRGTFVCEPSSVLAGQIHDFGLILPCVRGDLYPSLIQGFTSGAAHSQNQILTCDSFNSVDKQGNLILQMIDKCMAGVALVPVIPNTTPAYQVRQLQNHGIPVVFCHRRVAGVSAPLLTWNWRNVARMAAQTLLQYGHRRIAYIDVYRYSVSEAYEAGLREVLQENGLELRESDIYYGNLLIDDQNRSVDEQEKREALQRMLNKPDPVTALFCSGDLIAQFMYHLAQDMGLRVPQDLSIIGVGDKVRDTIILRRLTSITIHEFKLGEQAAILLQKMRDEEIPMDFNEKIEFPLSLSKGQSVGPPAG